MKNQQGKKKTRKRKYLRRPSTKHNPSSGNHPSNKVLVSAGRPMWDRLGNPIIVNLEQRSGVYVLPGYMVPKQMKTVFCFVICGLSHFHVGFCIRVLSAFGEACAHSWMHCSVNSLNSLPYPLSFLSTSKYNLFFISQLVFPWDYFLWGKTMNLKGLSKV